ncbi:MAG TPA: ferritin family protein [Acetomicrobium flavidum]|uniref:ferritin family protein n=1 Tax=Acetomicrobium flavidum TaxID=49896 RepID=UPI001B73A55A|nr:ferritin family protein [Acetomicrobium sp.]HOJ82534.1 ferritin family protein [Acetomicrobium flavidum]HOP88131.1 ferritin family protein [Acetomicrobium flavidum]HPP14773.1 ferritin family protein [Acetomicrobium flavidum]HPU69363.1 ferritin family protein [Acetomicrobium flavidum]
MADEKFDLKGALSYAIHAEIQANEFYKMWAQNTQKPALRKEIEELADWEETHKNTLSKYYLELFGEPFTADPNVIVDPALRVQADEFKDYYSQLRLISTAYLSELRAAEFYENLSQKVEPNETKQMFQDLANMERGHMAFIRKKYDELRGELEGRLML